MWQPIETAPRDGTPILLTADGAVGLGYIEVSERTGNDRGHATWINRDSEGEPQIWMGGTRSYQATHWMPLPVLPA